MKPEMVGDYVVGEFLAAGTVGNVFTAKHRETGKRAVVKFLQPDSGRTPEVQRRFVREVAVAQKLNHPNIVKHYDCGLAEDQIYFAMEYVDSGTLKEILLRRGKLPWREAVECAIQIAAALDHAHRLGIIHRDLKPANLFLSQEGHVKVGDFGLARDLNSTRITIDGHTVGTVRYMPPEQIYGDAALTGAADLYAMGCMLFEMIVGMPAFDGQTIMQIFQAHLHKEPTPPVQLVRDCPRDLSDLVLQLMAKKPAARPNSAADVQSALVDILHQRPMRLVARPPEEIAADLAAASNPKMPNLTTRLKSADLLSAATAARRRNRKSSAVVVGIVTLIIVVIVAAVWLFR